MEAFHQSSGFQQSSKTCCRQLDWDFFPETRTFKEEGSERVHGDFRETINPHLPIYVEVHILLSITETFTNTSICPLVTMAME